MSCTSRLPGDGRAGSPRPSLSSPGPSHFSAQNTTETPGPPAEKPPGVPAAPPLRPAPREMTSQSSPCAVAASAVWASTVVMVGAWGLFAGGAETYSCFLMRALKASIRMSKNRVITRIWASGCEVVRPRSRTPKHVAVPWAQYPNYAPRFSQSFFLFGVSEL